MRYGKGCPHEGAQVYSPGMIRPSAVAFCCLVLAAGCASDTLKNIPPAKMGIVKGQVTYKGQPLPGGKVFFRSVQGGKETLYDAVIDENGAYTISAPVGENQIAVNNQMLLNRRPSGGGAGMRRGAGRRPDAEALASNEVKGHYVAIPGKYGKAESSGLSCNVTEGAQTHNIQLD
jgi:hypothetical protein